MLRLRKHLVTQGMETVDVERHRHLLLGRRDPLVGRTIGQTHRDGSLRAIVLRQLDQKPRCRGKGQENEKSKDRTLVFTFRLLFVAIMLVHIKLDRRGCRP